MPDHYSNYDRDEQHRNDRSNEADRFRDERLPAHYREQDEWRRNREDQGEFAGRQSGGRDYEPDPGRDPQLAGRGQDWNNREREWRGDRYRENWRERNRSSSELIGPESRVTARISGQGRDWENRERNYNECDRNERDRNERNFSSSRDLENTSRDFNANSDRNQGRDWNRDQQSNWDREQHPLWNREERNRAWMREAQRQATFDQSDVRDWNRDRDWDRNRDRDRERGQQYGNRQYIESRGYDQYRSPNEYSGENMNETLTERVGRFMGIGPKGYRRSDERIREDVSERLEDHPSIDASNIEVNVKEGEVTLTGAVDNRQAKRLAEDVAAGCRGVRDVNNQIRVTSERQASGERQNVQRETGKTGRDRVA